MDTIHIILLMIENIYLEERKFWKYLDSSPWSLRGENTEINTQKDQIIIEKNLFFFLKPWFTTYFDSNWFAEISKLICRNFMDKQRNNWHVSIFACKKVLTTHFLWFLQWIMDFVFVSKTLIGMMLVNIPG